MPTCNRFSSKPSAPSVLPAAQIVPTESAGGVDQKTTAGQIAQAATAYNSSLQYITGTYVWYNGIIYRAAQNNLGSTPGVNTDAWKPVLIIQDTTLNVPSQFPSIDAALKFIAEATIAGIVTIQVATGTYNIGVGQLNLSHPYGSRIRLIGDQSSVPTVVLNFTTIPNPPTFPNIDPDSGSIYVNGGFRFGLLDGFIINGPSGATSLYGHCGVLAYDANLTLGSNVIINGFWYALAAVSGATITGPVDSEISLTPDSGGVFPLPGPFALYANAASVDIGEITIGAATLSDGIFLEKGAIANLLSATIASGLNPVFRLSGGSELYIMGTSGLPPSTTGFVVEGSATFESETFTIVPPSGDFIQLDGTFMYNGSLLVSTSEIDYSAVTADPVQIINNGDEVVRLTDTGIESENVPLQFSVDGNLGIEVGSTGAVEAPVSIETPQITIGTTDPLNALQGGTGTLNASGVLDVPATWASASTYVVATWTSAHTGEFQISVTGGTGFTIQSDAGATDAGATVNWLAVNHV